MSVLKDYNLSSKTISHIHSYLGLSNNLQYESVSSKGVLSGAIKDDKIVLGQNKNQFFIISPDADEGYRKAVFIDEHNRVSDKYESLTSLLHRVVGKNWNYFISKPIAWPITKQFNDPWDTSVYSNWSIEFREKYDSLFVEKWKNVYKSYHTKLSDIEIEDSKDTLKGIRHQYKKWKSGISREELLIRFKAKFNTSNNFGIYPELNKEMKSKTDVEKNIMLREIASDIIKWIRSYA